MAIYRNPTCLAILRELDEIVYHGDFKRAYRILENPDNADVLEAYLEDNLEVDDTFNVRLPILERK